MLRDYLLQHQVNVLLENVAAVPGSGNLAELAMLVQWRAGLRISEATALAWPDIDFELNQLTVRQGKGGQDRVVPLQAELRARLHAIRNYTAGTGRLVPLSSRRVAQCYAAAVVDSVKRLPDLASKKISTHTLRRSACIHWLLSGVPINQVQRWMGHSSIQTTQVYSDLIADLPGMMDRVR